MVSFAEIELAALNLSRGERIKLASRLIEGLPDQQGQEPLGATDEQLQQRLADAAGGAYDAVPWRDAVAQIREALSHGAG